MKVDCIEGGFIPELYFYSLISKRSYLTRTKIIHPGLNQLQKMTGLRLAKRNIYVRKQSKCALSGGKIHALRSLVRELAYASALDEVMR